MSRQVSSVIVPNQVGPAAGNLVWLHPTATNCSDEFNTSGFNRKTVTVFAQCPAGTLVFPPLYCWIEIGGYRVSAVAFYEYAPSTFGSYFWRWRGEQTGLYDWAAIPDGGFGYTPASHPPSATCLVNVTGALYGSVSIHWTIPSEKAILVVQCDTRPNPWGITAVFEAGD